MSKNLKLKKVNKSFIPEPKKKVVKCFACVSGFPMYISYIHILVDLGDLGSGHIDTAIRVHYMDANKTAGEEAKRQLHKNAACNLEQVLAATPGVWVNLVSIPSYGNLVCLATLMSSDRTKQICLWKTIYIYKVFLIDPLWLVQVSEFIKERCLWVRPCVFNWFRMYCLIYWVGLCDGMAIKLLIFFFFDFASNICSRQ